MEHRKNHKDRQDWGKLPVLSGDFGAIVDAYGGGGLFSATLVDTDVEIVLVESNKSAVNDAHVNLADHDVVIEQAAVEQWRPIEAGLVIADPARNGLGKVGAEAIVATEATRIVLVSCDAVAGARHARDHAHFQRPGGDLVAAALRIH